MVTPLRSRFVDYISQALEDAVRLVKLDSPDARTLVQVLAAQVDRLTAIEGATFLSAVGAESLGMQNPPEADPKAVMLAVLIEQPDLAPVVDRLLTDPQIDIRVASPLTDDDEAQRRFLAKLIERLGLMPESREREAARNGQPPPEPEPVLDMPLPPNRVDLYVASGAAVVSMIGGLAGALIGDRPALDWLWIAWCVLGGLACLFLAVALTRRRKYISLLVASGIRATRTDDPAQIDANIDELTRVGATREVALLLSQRHCHDRQRNVG